MVPWNFVLKCAMSKFYCVFTSEIVAHSIIFYFLTLPLRRRGDPMVSVLDSGSSVLAEALQYILGQNTLVWLVWLVAKKKTIQRAPISM